MCVGEAEQWGTTREARISTREKDRRVTAACLKYVLAMATSCVVPVRAVNKHCIVITPCDNCTSKICESEAGLEKDG